MERIGVEVRLKDLKLAHLVHEKQDTIEYVIASFLLQSHGKESLKT